MHNQELTELELKQLSDMIDIQIYLDNHSHESLDDIVLNLTDMGYSKQEISDRLRDYIDTDSFIKSHHTDKYHG